MKKALENYLVPDIEAVKGMSPDQRLDKVADLLLTAIQRRLARESLVKEESTTESTADDSAEEVADKNDCSISEKIS